MTTIDMTAAQRLANDLSKAYEALESYREHSKALRLGSDGWGRPAYYDLGAFQVFKDFEADGALKGINARDAFAQAILAGVDFEDGNDGAEYDAQHDAVYDWLGEVDLLKDETEEDDES